jgi:hypothetical protein
MSATPQPPRPPQPPSPPRTSGNLVAIIVLVLGLIAVVSVMAVWLGVRVLSHSVNFRVKEESGGKKEVAIQTPLGSTKVTKETDPAFIGLPVYPGAVRVEGHDSASVNLELPGEENVQVAAVKFETDDPVEKVKDYYKKQLGDSVTRFRDRDEQGQTVFEMKQQNEEKIVALKSEGFRTRIALVRVIHASGNDTN